MQWFGRKKEQTEAFEEPKIVRPEFNHNTELSYYRYMEYLEKQNAPKRFFDSIVDAIEAFESFRKYRFENQYQIELASYLRAKFPNVSIEEQRNNARPDITIGDIAIEIKGPTKAEGLYNIPGKLLRYEKEFERVIVVLFDVRTDYDAYVDWKEGIKDKFPNVRIIRL